MTYGREERYPSLTPNAVQISWKVPTNFPECPSDASDGALEEYASRLGFATNFSHNEYNSSWAVDQIVHEGVMVVITNMGDDSIKRWGVACVSVENDVFLHRSVSTFFTLHGAMKCFCELTGKTIGDTFDDYC